MKNLNDVLNESLFGKKTIKHTNIPVQMPDKYKNLVIELSRKNKIKDEDDLYDSLTYSMDELWSEIAKDFKYKEDFFDNQYRMQDEVRDVWFKQIKELVL